MIRVLLFASLREALGTGELDIPWRAGLRFPTDVIDALGERFGPKARDVLGADSVICARNQQVCKRPLILEDGDEVAFYPPVTGG